MSGTAGRYEIEGKGKKRGGKTPWKWRITSFLSGGAIARQTVHNSELAKDLEYEAMKKRDDIVRVEVEEA